MAASDHLSPKQFEGCPPRCPKGPEMHYRTMHGLQDYNSASVIDQVMGRAEDK